MTEKKKKDEETKNDAGSDSGAAGGGGKGAGAAGGAPAPDPSNADPKDLEISELKKGISDLQKKLADGEIKGMSESTAHSLIETMREFKAELSKRESAPSRRFWPW